MGEHVMKTRDHFRARPQRARRRGSHLDCQQPAGRATPGGHPRLLTGSRSEAPLPSQQALILPLPRSGSARTCNRRFSALGGGALRFGAFAPAFREDELPHNWIVALNVVSVLSGAAAALPLHWGSLGGVGAVVGVDLGDSRSLNAHSRLNLLKQSASKGCYPERG